jgi:hypothetical protein
LFWQSILLSKVLRMQQDLKDEKNEATIKDLENKVKDHEAALEKKDFVRGEHFKTENRTRTEPNPNRPNYRSIRVFGFGFGSYMCYISGYGFGFGS